MGAFAWVTLATNDSYSLGALVLAHSLRRVGTHHDLAVLITPGVTPSMRAKLATVFNLVQEVNVLDSKDQANLAVLQRPELGITFTKLHCWRLTQYEKCVFIDADALVVRNCDELFEREELSAAPDVGWPDCFNSGVFVFRPSQQTFASITTFAASQGSFDGADQGLLNMYFSDWAHKDISKHLPFIYNMCSTATYSYAPAFKQYGENVRIIHFIGATKPWLQYFDTMTGIVQPPPGCSHLQPLLQIWWNIFCDNVHPQLSDVMAASNMTTIWHDSNPFLTNSNSYNCATHLFNPGEDTYNEIDSGEPDFSEFKDPWENYSMQTDPFFNNVAQKNDDRQYYSDTTHVHHTESSQLISHNHRGAELPTEYHENLSFKSEAQEEILQDREAQGLFEQECLANHTFDSQRSLENINNITCFCDTFEYVHKNSEDHNHYTHHQNIHENHNFGSNNRSEQTNNVFDKPHTLAASSSHNSSRNIYKENTNNRIQTDLNNPSPTPTSAPCTNPYNVATQSELSASTCTENANGGLAGALSKLTLGEARTDEQQAVEDHMRKQNWEQGHIDYMGRDSFDNIMKKINQTLASAPQRQNSPEKETRQPKKSSRKSSEVEAAIEESEVALPVLAAEDKSELNVSEGSSKDIWQRISSSEVTPSPEIEKQEEIGETDNTSCEQTTISSTDTIEEATKSVPTTKVASVPNVIQQSQDTEVVQETLAKQEIVDIKQTETISPELVKEIHIPQEIKQVVDTETIHQITESITEASLDPATVPSDLLEPRDVETSAPAQHIATQIVSEATTECPVPIQVAESVLQAEPKESVSEDPRPVVEAVVSSIILPVQELAASVSETLFEPGQTLPLEPIPHLGQLNGDDPSLNLEAESTSAPSMTSSALISRSPNVVSVVHEFAPRTQQETAQESQPTAEVSQSMVPESQPTLPPSQDTQPQAKLEDTSVDTLEDTAASITSPVSLDSPTSQKTKLTVKLPESGDIKDVPDETQSLVSIQQQIAETTSSIEDSTIVSMTPSEECPRRPSRSKDLKIPGTPIVISPTPPTSPPLEAEAAKIVQEESQKQAQTGSMPQAEEETKVETSIQAQPVASTETQAGTSVEQNIESQPETPTEEKIDAQPQSLVESEQKVKKVKKIVKKSSAESDSPSSQESEGSGKKVKKVTKKVVKKPKEGEETEGAVSSDKPKKVVKKVTKTVSSTSLETNKTVPETPPPSTSSEVPIPPKRKAKSTSSSKVTDKKTDES